MSGERAVSTAEVQSTWSTIKQRSGKSFTFDSNSAKSAAAACASLTADLAEAMGRASQVSNVNGFGAFKSSLEAKGHYEHQTRLLRKQVNECMRIALTMQQSFLQAGGCIGEAEASNTANLNIYLDAGTP